MQQVIQFNPIWAAWGVLVVSVIGMIGLYCKEIASWARRKIGYFMTAHQIQAFNQEIQELRAELNEKRSLTHAPVAKTSTVDYIGACGIVDAYIESAIIDKSNIVRLSIRQDIIERFDKITGAKLGEHEYNRALLHKWIQSNAARFLVVNRQNLV